MLPIGQHLLTGKIDKRTFRALLVVAAVLLLLVAAREILCAGFVPGYSTAH
jgi:hypothetical protein